MGSIHDGFRCMIFPMSIALFLITQGCPGNHFAPGGDGPPRDTPYEIPADGAPPWAPPPGTAATFHYRYYPSSYVYYDIHREVYFYACCGGVWRVTDSAPQGVALDAADYVHLEMDTENPQEYHLDVLLRHPAPD